MQSIFRSIQARRLITVLALALSVPVMLAMALAIVQIWQQKTNYAKIIEVDEVVHFGIDGMVLVDALRRERTAALPLLQHVARTAQMPIRRSLRKPMR